jgi:hypothetical protein
MNLHFEANMFNRIIILLPVQTAENVPSKALVTNGEAEILSLQS